MPAKVYTDSAADLGVFKNKTLAVLGFHKAFWIAGSPSDYPDNLLVRMIITIAVGVVLLWLCVNDIEFVKQV